MKHPLIRSAVAAAIATGAAAGAHATDIATFSTGGRTNVVVYLSGSTAVDNSAFSIIANTMCQAGTSTKYASQVTFAGGGSETMFYCQAAAASGLPTTDYLLVEKESTTGSVNGAGPLINVGKGLPSGLSFFDPTQGAAIDTCTVNGTVTSNTCPNSVFISNVTPTGGVADVEAKLLLKVPGGGTLSSSDIGTYLTGAPGLDTLWGVTVTKNLYYTLQSAEGLSSKCPSSNYDSPACAPSLSRPQVAALFSHSDFPNANLTQWTQLGLNNTTDNNIYLCRRDIGSGTEASFEAYFLGARCATQTSGSDLHMATQDGTIVIEAGSNGGVRSCLQAHYQHNNTLAIQPFNSDLGTTFGPITPGGDQWAVGILSSEETAANLSGANDSWRMVAIDGVLPTLENVVNGFDPYFSTDVWYTVTGTTGYPNASSLTVYNAIRAQVGHPTVVSTADAGYKNMPWGDGGDLSPAAEYSTLENYTSFPVTQAEVEAQPVNIWSKSANGSVNNCEIPTLFRTSGGATYSTIPEGTLLGTGSVNKQ